VARPPLSGPTAPPGKDMYSGCELYWKETGWQMAGRKVEVILEDNEGNPATTLTKARKLVESDKGHMLAGVILYNGAQAGRDQQGPHAGRCHPLDRRVRAGPLRRAAGDPHAVSDQFRRRPHP